MVKLWSRSSVFIIAERYINMPTWTPINDSYSSFHSSFVRDYQDSATSKLITAEYGVMPYVYGSEVKNRSAITTKSHFISQIQSGACPGGWDINTGWGTGHFSFRGQLAGIDCSEFVMKCWGFDWRRGFSTRNLHTISLEIDRRELKIGDILVRAGNHVRIFNEWADSGRNYHWIYESIGVRDDKQIYRNQHINQRFKDTDDKGCVGKWNRQWDNAYTPYSIFPQFTEPLPTGRITNPTPLISIKIAGSGNLGIGNLSLDGLEENFYARNTIDASHNSRACQQINFRPRQSLSLGIHKLRIDAINNVLGKNFWDYYQWQFEIV